MIELIINHDQLHREYYNFYLENEYHIWLNDYSFQTRLSPRHKWTKREWYTRIGDTRNIAFQIKLLKEEEVILNDIIKEEVEKVLISQLQIGKWSERK